MVLELNIIIAVALSYSYYPHVQYKKKIPEGFKEDTEGYFVSYGYRSFTKDKWESLGTKNQHFKYISFKSKMHVWQTRPLLQQALQNRTVHIFKVTLHILMVK